MTLSYPPQTLALDFDGVLCDGILEYFQTSWRAYRQFWPTSTMAPPDGLQVAFGRLRPVIASGWEMPLLLRAMIMGFSVADVKGDWPGISKRILAEADLSPKTLGARVDLVRDQWISENLQSWLELHRFYPGVIGQLQRWLDSELRIVIISTKETRFIQQLLRAQQVTLPTEQIFGRDRQLPKAEILRQLQTQANQEQQGLPIWFVEDFLPTLETVKQARDLRSIGLFLADWGYNTPQDHQTVVQDPRMGLLTLAQFSQNFARWQF